MRRGREGGIRRIQDGTYATNKNWNRTPKPMNWITALGLLAATLTTLSFLPQVVKTWRMKSAEDLSLGTFSMLCTGVACWLAYGLLVGDLPIILANGVTLVLAGSVLVLAIIYKRRASRNTPEASSSPSTDPSESVP